MLDGRRSLNSLACVFVTWNPLSPEGQSGHMDLKNLAGAGRLMSVLLRWTQQCRRESLLYVCRLLFSFEITSLDNLSGPTRLRLLVEILLDLQQGLHLIL